MHFRPAKSWKFLGHFPEMSGTFPGKFREVSENFPRIFRDLFGQPVVRLNGPRRGQTNAHMHTPGRAASKTAARAKI